ncbi:MAG: hypothetical protein K2G67_06665 [Muribaculaceae bacterium]|nr:hypothetical protein [Muribaculaceae bacterium]
MKTFKLTMAVLAFMCIGALSSCNKDDNGPKEPIDIPTGGEITHASIMGTWEHMGQEPYSDTYIQEITFGANDEMLGRFKERGENNYSNFSGEYRLENNDLILHVKWSDDTRESWVLTILAINDDSATFEMQQGSRTAVMYFKRKQSLQPAN